VEGPLWLHLARFFSGKEACEATSGFSTPLGMTELLGMTKKWTLAYVASVNFFVIPSNFVVPSEVEEPLVVSHASYLEETRAR
jgi:hypothetical protein